MMFSDGKGKHIFRNMQEKWGKSCAKYKNNSEKG